MELNRILYLVAIFISMANAVHAASLVNGQTLHFTAATTGGGTVEPTLGTGSYFGIISPYSAVYVRVNSYNGIALGSVQPAAGSHSGSVNGTESPDIDYPWGSMATRECIRVSRPSAYWTLARLISPDGVSTGTGASWRWAVGCREAV